MLSCYYASALDVYEGDGEGEGDVLTEAFSSEVLMAFNKTMEVYLLSSA